MSITFTDCRKEDGHDRATEDRGEEKLAAGHTGTIYGMAAHDMSRAALRTRASMEHLFILITMGDLLGVPVLPPYYSLRLLPYVVPRSPRGSGARRARRTSRTRCSRGR